jgi:CheY-like chemotaxis protein
MTRLAMIRMMEVTLSDHGRGLTKPNSGTEAPEFLLKTDVVVIRMDVSMSEINGFELAETSRRHRA